MKAPITVMQLERKFGNKVSSWKGNCFALATHAAELLDDGSVAVYGHFIGAVHPKSMFAERAKLGWVQHGWVKLADGPVLDPTRWVFEHKKPYIFVGSAEDYDEGGNRLRMAMIGPPPPFDPSDDVKNITPRLCTSRAWSFVEHLLGLDNCLMDDDYCPGDINVDQLRWLAHFDPHRMQGNAPAIYEMLEKLKMGALIPIDNKLAAKRMAEGGA